MAAKVTVVSNSQSMGLGGGDYVWSTRTEAGAHPSTQGFTHAIQKHGGGTGHPIISDYGSDQGGHHPSSAPLCLSRRKPPQRQGELLQHPLIF